MPACGRQAAEEGLEAGEETSEPVQFSEAETTTLQPLAQPRENLARMGPALPQARPYPSFVWLLLIDFQMAVGQLEL